LLFFSNGSDLILFILVPQKVLVGVSDDSETVSGVLAITVQRFKFSKKSLKSEK
jgi:hypothetical protein